MKNSLDLFVLPSDLVKGQKGLFAGRPFLKDECIGEYKGEKITNAEYDKRKNHQYGVAVNSRYVIDARRVRCKLKYANDAEGLIKSKKKNNATLYTIKGKVYMFATRNIPEGSEIYCSYGKSFWDNL